MSVMKPTARSAGAGAFAMECAVSSNDFEILAPHGLSGARCSLFCMKLASFFSTHRAPMLSHRGLK